MTKEIIRIAMLQSFDFAQDFSAIRNVALQSVEDLRLSSLARRPGQLFIRLHGCVDHSYLRASIGCKFEAWRAGYQPKSMPMAADTTNAKSTDDGDTTNSELVTTDMA